MMWFYVMAAALGALAATAVLAAAYLPRVWQLVEERNEWRMLAADLHGRLAKYEPDDADGSFRVLHDRA